MALFTQRHPDVDLTVLDDHRQGLLPRLARWELDLALIYDHQALPDAEVELERTHLLDDPFDLVLPRGHPLARRAPVALGQLAPAVLGTRLDVADVIETIRESDRSVERAAAYLELPVDRIEACLRYYADYGDEIDEWIDRARAIAEREEVRWQRRREALA